jgi:hypothetical protein
MDSTVQEEEWRRRLQSVVAVAEPLLYTGVAVTARRTWSWWHGPDDDGDGQADREVAMVERSGRWRRGPNGGGGGGVDSTTSTTSK